MGRRITYTALIILAIAISQTGCVSSQTQADEQCTNSGQYPDDFKEIVTAHMNSVFSHGQIQRNIVIRPPSPEQVHYQGEVLKGYTGLADFSLRKEGEKTFNRVAYCYFIVKGEVVLFEDQKMAQWCK
ncbi:MAG: hypothetical protein ABR533_12565 [Desulfonatronovibrio sp.]|nr:hypothetical protein [Desulfovibrionales bacterium]